MNFIEIKVVGIASKRIISNYKEAFNCSGLNHNEVLMFCSFSEFDIPIGQVFNVVKDIEKKSEFNTQIVLKNVTQQYWKPFDSIPSGWKTICLFDFILGQIPKVVQELPLINDWYDSNTSILFSV